MQTLTGKQKDQIIMRNELISWSILAPTPQCYYHKPSNSHIVYWQGVAMTRAHAMILVQELYLGAYATPLMKISAYNELKRVYHLGAFGHQNWEWALRESNANDHLTRLRKWLQKHNPKLFTDLLNSYDIKTAMSWFTKDYEQVLDD